MNVSHTLRKAFTGFARGLLSASTVLVLLGICAAAVTAIAVTAVSELAWAERHTVFSAGEITNRGVVLLALQAGLPSLIVLAILTAAGFVAVSFVLGKYIFRETTSTFSPRIVSSSLSRGIKRALPYAAAFVLVLAELLLALIFAPLISIASLVLLAVFGARKALLRKTLKKPTPGNSWLSFRMLFVYSVPFGLFFVILLHSLLILPVATFIDVFDHFVMGRSIRSRKKLKQFSIFH